jgi:hypothetical protein
MLQIIRRAAIPFVALSLILFAFGSGRAMADTLTTFDVTGTFDNGASLSGTMEIDTTIGKVTNDNLSASAPINVSWTFPNIYGQFCNGAECVIDSRNGSDFLILSLHTGSLVGYTGGSINNFSDFNNTSSGASSLLTSGKLTPTPVPEPDTLFLLGVAFLAVGVFRREWLTSRRGKSISPQ